MRALLEHLDLAAVAVPDGSTDDIDTWVQDPAGNLVWFRAREAGLMHLDRDDRGLTNDVIVVNGKQVVNPLNQEVVTLRGIAPGEYTVNVHYYDSKDGKPVDVVSSVRIAVSDDYQALAVVSVVLKAMTVARIAIGALPGALVLLMLAHGELMLLVAFTMLLGASQGVITIVRGAVPLALFGAKGYGAVLGLIATPILLVNAFSPTLFALLVEQIGWQNAFNALLVCAILSWLAIELMSRWYERTRTARRLATS